MIWTTTYRLSIYPRTKSSVLKLVRFWVVMKCFPIYCSLSLKLSNCYVQIYILYFHKRSRYLGCLHRNCITQPTRKLKLSMQDISLITLCPYFLISVSNARRSMKERISIGIMISSSMTIDWATFTKKI